MKLNTKQIKRNIFILLLPFLVIIMGAGIDSYFFSADQINEGTLNNDRLNATVFTSTAEVELVYSGADGMSKIGAFTGNAGVDTLDEFIAHAVPSWRLKETFTVTHATVAPFGLGIEWTDGYSFDADSQEGVILWSAGTGTVTDNDTTYLYQDTGDPYTLKLTTTQIHASDLDQIEIARFWAVNNRIYASFVNPELHKSTKTIYHGLDTFFPVLVESGMITSEDVTGGNDLDVIMTAGDWFQSLKIERSCLEIKSQDSYLVRWYQVGGVWLEDTSSVEIDATQWISGGNLTGTNNKKYYKSYFVTDCSHIHWIYPSTQYDNLAEAIEGPLDDGPPGSEDFPRSSAVIMKHNDTTFPTAGGDRWIDIRQQVGANAATAGVTDHGDLAGLSDDDHVQYVLADGSRYGDVFNESMKNDHAYQWIDNMTDIKGLWLMGGSGTTLDDEFSTGHTGTLMGGLSMATDRSQKGFCYPLLFNGTTDHIDLGDHADFSMLSGGTDIAFSFCALINVTNGGTIQMIISKFDLRTGVPLKEYYFGLDGNEKLILVLYDQSTISSPRIVSNSALSMGWHFVVGTYDGRGGADAEVGLELYIDGAIDAAPTKTTAAGYVDMEDTTTPLSIGSSFGSGTTSDPSLFFQADISKVILEKSELSAATIYKMWKAVEAKYGL